MPGRAVLAGLFVFANLAIAQLETPSNTTRCIDGVLVAAIHPFYTAAGREFTAAGRAIVGSAPVGYEGTAGWLESIGSAANVGAAAIGAAKDKFLPAIRGALAAARIDGRITVSGYEGSELLVARLLIESGAQVPYVGTACPRTLWSQVDREWLEAHGARVQYRASLEQDRSAMQEFHPDLAIGTTPGVQAAKELAIPAVYFTNLISARPLMGPAGAGSLAQVVNAALGNKRRFEQFRAFFEHVGTGHAAGIWEQTPHDRPEFREHYQRLLAKQAIRSTAEDGV